jgi:hypothetical protein
LVSIATRSGGKHASPVGSAERMVRLPLLTQACRDENVVDTRPCRPSPPQNAALDKTRGNGFQFVQALKVTMASTILLSRSVITSSSCISSAMRNTLDH